MALPTGDLPSGLPGAVQLLGRWGSEPALLAVAAELEAAGTIGV